MLSAYVCRQCRTRLSRRVATVRSRQWQPRATFLSMRNPQTQDHADAEGRQDEAHPPEPAQEASHNGPNIHYVRRPGRYSHLRDDTDSALAYAGDRGQATGEETDRFTGPEWLGCAQAIDASLRDVRIGRAWRIFERNYTSRDCVALTEPNHGDLPLLKDGKIFKQLLYSVNGLFCKNKTDITVSPTIALFTYERLGLSRPEHWQVILLRLTHQVIRAVNASPDEPLQDLPTLLHELLSVWRLFFQCKGRNPEPVESVSVNWHLPDIAALPELYRSKDFNMRMQDYHPNYIGNPVLGFCAVYLYSISDALDDSIRQEAAPFLQLLERLLAGATVNPIYDRTTTSNDFNKLPSEVREQIATEILAAPQKAMIAIGGTAQSLDADADATGDTTTSLEDFQFARISRAVRFKDSSLLLDRIWEEVQTAYTTETRTVEIPRRLYNAFLSGYMIVLNSPRAVQVWNHMIAQGVKPDIQSWVALLEGCTKAKDLKGLNAMWTRMLNSGIEPDNYAWTARVHGLMALRDINQGLIALDDMGKRWLSAEAAINGPQKPAKGRKAAKKLPPSSKAVNNFPKPSIEVINGAISALAQIPPQSMRNDKCLEYVQKILAWARNFDIKPDAITYNTLIQLYLRARDTRTAYRILTLMEKEGLPADIATYTMLMTTAFDNQLFDGQSETEQRSRILSIFDDLEASGMKLNAYIYSTAIDRMLKKYNNYTAVRAIMEHMQTKGVIASAHTYTSLITHYFQSKPPNIRDVDTVVHQLFTATGMPSDRFMFDRLIEGYASHGEVGKMMSVLARMSKNGNLPGWNALTAVVRALLQEGDYERARSVVHDVERGEGVAQAGVTGDRNGRYRFFAAVRESGLELEDQRIGDFTGSGPDQGALEETMGQQGEPGSVPYEQEPGSMIDAERYEQFPPAMEHGTGDDSDAGLQREPGSVDEEEDIHGFLTDEPVMDPRRVQRP
ncbi:hypothetical protein BDW02DRAFT_543958 [Decorospora gaudefroyi]|uniref:PROP1-like PPR domain-containing protein n=1 Tax=Decorospora gaudefroyi TaxID=184978 RepID=A0A6A5KNC8_9PLEO|nr:hypothetical protein BDW02DRAFT_543958 [Decorospora gaudefroyi]